MEYEIIEQIKLLLISQGVECENMTFETTLQSFEMLRDDIEFFFESYGKLFKVDFTGFRYNDYFTEDLSVIELLKKVFSHIFYSTGGYKQSTKIPITMRHLVKVAEYGKWFKP